MDADVTDRLVPVTSSEALQLLGTVRVGRVGYSDRALPSIQAVSHMIDAGEIIMRSHGRPPVISPAHSGSLVWPTRRMQSIRKRSPAGG